MMLSSTLPNTPGRGRSRFSKMLPSPPQEHSPDRSPISPSNPLNSPLPALPHEELSGREHSRRQIPKHRRGSLSSNSSYDSLQQPRSLSDSSESNERDYLSGVESEVGPTPPLPPKHIKKLENQDIEPTPPLPPKHSERIGSQPTALLPPKQVEKLASQEIGPILPKQEKLESQEVEPPIHTHPLSNSTKAFNSSPVRPEPARTELWRRRSQRSERSIKLTDLKLDKSNGSTAKPPNRQEQPPKYQNFLPRSLRSKPIPARPAPPQPDLMGNKLAKLKHDSGNESSSSQQHEAPPAQPYPTFQRLPTPDYLRSNAENIRPSTSKSAPTTPYTPPEDKPPEVPRKSESRGGARSAALSKSFESTSTVRPSSLHSRNPSETLTITSEPPLQTPQPQHPITTNLLTPQASPKVKHRRHPSSASDFPTLSSPLDDGTIFPGPPLELVHYECYHNHRHMRLSRNATCSVGCMVCGKLDKEMRWRCTWCCLSACAGCMQILASTPGKDLQECLERVAVGKQ